MAATEIQPADLVDIVGVCVLLVVVMAFLPATDPVTQDRLHFGALVALVWGIVFIVVACLLGIYNRVVTGHLESAVFGPHGVVNLLFYLGFLAGGYLLATRGSFGF